MNPLPHAQETVVTTMSTKPRDMFQENEITRDKLDSISSPTPIRHVVWCATVRAISNEGISRLVRLKSTGWNIITKIHWMHSAHWCRRSTVL